MPRLERIAQRKLQVASEGALTGDFAEVSGGGIQVQAPRCTNSSPIRMIDEIIGFRAKLESLPVGDGELLKEHQVPILETRSVDVVAYTGLQVESARGRLCVVRREILGRIGVRTEARRDVTFDL